MLIQIELNGKRYMSGKITNFLSKEALKIQKEGAELAKKAKQLMELQKNLQENMTINDDIDPILNLASEVTADTLNLIDKRTWLICEVYENKFTPDELDKALDKSEVEKEFNKIIGAVQGVVVKN